MKFRMRHADKVVGAFVFLALILVLVLIMLIGFNQRWFQRNYVYKSHFLTANSLTVGTPIMMKGFEVGRITKVVLNDENTVDVDVQVYEDYVNRITENSVLELITSPIGLGSSLVLYRGLSKVHLDEGREIPSLDYPLGRNIVDKKLADVPLRDDTVNSMIAKLNDILDRTYQNVDVLWKTWIGENVNGPKGSLGANLATLQSGLDLMNDVFGQTKHLMTSIDSQGTKVMTSVGDNVPQMLEQLNAVLAQVKSMTEDLKGTTAMLKDPSGLVTKLIDPKGSVATLLNDNNDLWNRLGRMLDNVDGMLKNVEGMTLDLRKATSGVAGEVPKISGLLNETQQAIAQAKDVLEGLKNNPLLKGGISDKTEQPSTFQSLRKEDF